MGHKSAASVSASSFSSKQSSTGSAKDGNGISASAKSTASIERVLFGLLYFMSTNLGSSHRKTTIVFVIFDFLQLVVLPLGKDFPWQGFTKDLQSLFEPVSLHSPAAGLGYNAAAAMVMVAVGIVVLCVLDVLFVGHNVRMNHFTHVWPIKLLALVVGVLFHTFFISFLNLLLLVLDCKYESRLLYLQHFPEIACWGWPNAMFSVIAAVAGIVVLAMTLSLVLTNSEPDPLSQRPLSSNNPQIILRLFIVRALLVFVNTMLGELRALLGIFFVVCSGYMVFQMIRYLPYYSRVMNELRTALFVVLLWTSSCSVVIVIVPDLSDLISTVFLAGSPVAFLLGWTAARLRYFALSSSARRHTRKASENNVVCTAKFRCPQDAEIASRCIRDASAEQFAQRKLEADAILKAGLAQFPKSSALHLSYSNFCRHVLANDQLELAFLERARHLEPPFQERFAIYRKEKEREQQRRSEASGEQVMDLISYLEFQKNYKSAKDSHVLALRAIRHFWKVLLDKDNALSRLPEASRIIDMYEQRAEKHYKALIDKYPRSVKVLRAFANFCENVLCDPSLAEQFYRRATRYEAVEARAVLNNDDEDYAGTGEAETFHGVVSDDRDGIVTITSKGVIQSVNNQMCKMFGYKRNDLINKKVNMLMPSPYREEHDQYLNNYLRSGIAKMLGLNRRIEACHKDGSLFPIRLAVSRMEVGGQVLFGGVLHKMEEDVSGIMNINTKGTILSVNAQVKKLFGYEIPEMLHRNVSMLMPPYIAERHDTYVQTYLQSGQAKVVGQGPRNVDARHKDGSFFPISLQVSRVEEAGNIIFCGKINPVEDLEGVVTIDTNAVMQTVNRHLCDMFGYEPADLVNHNVNMLMPEPYASYHQKYVNNYLTTKQAKIIGQRRELVGRHRDGSTFEVFLTVSRITVEDRDMFAGRISRISKNDESEGVVTADAVGTIKSCNNSTVAMFGWRAHELVGRNVRMLMPAPWNAKHDSFMRDYVTTGVAKVIGTAGRNVMGLHKEGKTFPILLEILESTVDDVRLFTAKITNVADVDALINIDTKGTVLTCNRSAVKLFGFCSSEDFVGQNIKMCMPSEVAIHHDDYLKSYLKTGRKRIVGQKRVVTAKHVDGSEFNVTIEVAEITVDGKKMYSGKLSRLSDAAQAEHDTSHAVASIRSDASDGIPATEVVERLADSSSDVGFADNDSSLSLSNAPDCSPLSGTRLLDAESASHRSGNNMRPTTRHSNRMALPSSARNSASMPPDQTGPIGSIKFEPLLSSSSCVEEVTQYEQGETELQNRHLRESASLDDSASLVFLPESRHNLLLRETLQHKNHMLDNDSLPPGLAELHLVNGSPKGSTTVLSEEQASAIDDAASEVSSAASTTTGGRKRRRNRLIDNNKKAKSAMYILQKAVILVLAFLCLLVVGSFVAVYQTLQQYLAMLRRIRISGERQRTVQLTVILARTLQLAALGRYPDVALTDASRELRDTAQAMLDSHLELYHDLSDSTSTDSLRRLYQSGSLTARELRDVEPPSLVPTVFNLWHLGSSFAQHAQLVAADLAANLTTAPTACLSNAPRCTSWRFVMDNGPYVLGDAVSDATSLQAAGASDIEHKLQLIYVSILASSLGLLLLLGFWVFRPSFNRVWSERSTTIALFLHVPIPVAKSLSRKRIPFQADSDDDESSSDDAAPKDENKAAAVATPTANSRRNSQNTCPKLLVNGDPARRNTYPDLHSAEDAMYQSAEHRRSVTFSTCGGSGEDAKVAAEALGNDVGVLNALRVVRETAQQCKSRFLPSVHRNYRVGPDDAASPDKNDKRRAKANAAKKLSESSADRRLLVKLTLRYSVALAIIGMCFLASFAGAMVGVTGYAGHANEIVLAAMRNTKLVRVAMLMREQQLQADAAVWDWPGGGPSYPLNTSIAADLTHLWSLHNALVFGDSSRDVPGCSPGSTQYDLLFQPDCAVANCPPQRDSMYTVVSHGLDSMLQYLVKQLRLFVMDRQETSGLNDETFRFLWRVGVEHLDGALLHSLLLYEDAAVVAVSADVALQGALFGTTLAVLGVVYLSLLRPMIRQLRDEARRTSRMLLMIPPEVSDKVQVIKEHLKKLGQQHAP